jgi:hypothetical protein
MPGFNSEEPKDDTFIETSNTHSSFRKVKHKKTYCFENQTPLTEDKHVDNMTHNVDANTQNQSSYPDNLQLGKNDISSFPPSPALFNCKVILFSGKSVFSVDGSVIVSSFFLKNKRVLPLDCNVKEILLLL